PGNGPALRRRPPPLRRLTLRGNHPLPAGLARPSCGSVESMPLDHAVQQILPSVRADLERLVRIPSVSADPSAAPHLRRSADEVASLLAAAGQSAGEVLTR